MITIRQMAAPPCKKKAWEEYSNVGFLVRFGCSLISFCVLIFFTTYNFKDLKLSNPLKINLIRLGGLKLRSQSPVQVSKGPHMVSSHHP